MDLRIMTYNICSGHYFVNAEHAAKNKDYRNVKHVAEVIKKYSPDIVGLNEVRDYGSDKNYTPQVKELAEMLDYPYYYFARALSFNGTNPYGNALLSRYPLLSASTIWIPDPQVRIEGEYYETRCVLHAKLEACDILVSHFGLPDSEKANAVDTVMDILEGVRENCVLMGDFNMTPDDDRLSPIFNTLYDTANVTAEQTMSFRSDNPTIKIDYILVSKNIAVKSFFVPEEIASDHRPCISDIQL